MALYIGTEKIDTVIMRDTLSTETGADTESTFIPEDLPKDFKQTVYDNMGGYKYAVGLLYRASLCLGSTYTFLGKDIITSDGQHFTGGSNTTPKNVTINTADKDGWWWIILRDDEALVWNRSNNYSLKHRGLTWVQCTEGAMIHVYYNSPLVNAAEGLLDHLRVVDAETYNTYTGNGNLTNVKGPLQTTIRVKYRNSEKAVISSCMKGYCNGCYALRYANIECEQLSAVKDFSAMFQNCYSLV